MAQRHRDFCFGFVGQKKPDTKEDFILMTPGVALVAKDDGLGQTYRTPRDCVFESGCDVIIVGRNLYAKGDPVVQAKVYRRAGWDAYNERQYLNL